MKLDPWPDEWTRGALPFAVLSAIRRGPTHGYAILQILQKANIGTFQGGTIYPLLQRLTEQQLVSSHWEHPATGPARKIFGLTEEGQRVHALLVERWEQFDVILKGLSSK
ncbi:PadR family transcriptional regulator [bacterium RCC_150]